jgi:hypothetical protein
MYFEKRKGFAGAPARSKGGKSRDEEEVLTEEEETEDSTEEGEAEDVADEEVLPDREPGKPESDREKTGKEDEEAEEEESEEEDGEQEAEDEENEEEEEGGEVEEDEVAEEEGEESGQGEEAEEEEEDDDEKEENADRPANEAVAGEEKEETVAFPGPEAEGDTQAEKWAGSDIDPETGKAPEKVGVTEAVSSSLSDPDRVFPLLIRCAEARRDSAAAEAYQKEYAAIKEVRVEQEAKSLIQTIEDGARTGALFSDEGLTVGVITPEVLRKLADLFGREAAAGTLTVPAAEDPEVGSSLVLTVLAEGIVRAEAAAVTP